MQVSVRLFATLRRFAGNLPAGKTLELELSKGSTLQDLVDQLGIPAEETKVAFVNGRAQDLDYALQQGDEVGIFPPIGGGSMDEITVDAWLYGNLARYGGQAATASHANLKVTLPAGSTLGDLLVLLKMPTEERGITFINGELSAMPGVQPDLAHPLCDGDRVAFFHLRSMWPFQYRFGVPMVGEMSAALQTDDDHGLHHSYEGDQENPTAR
jgi:molybdopterin converting factor small subunit